MIGKGTGPSISSNRSTPCRRRSDYCPDPLEKRALAGLWQPFELSHQAIDLQFIEALLDSHKRVSNDKHLART